MKNVRPRTGLDTPESAKKLIRKFMAVANIKERRGLSNDKT
jgi:hypothetical protein